jgi:amidohydrolase
MTLHRGFFRLPPSCYNALMLNRPSHNWQARLDEIIAERTAQMIKLRRRLHSYPEPSGEEFKTSLHLYQTLVDEGFEVLMGPEGRGVVADNRPVGGGALRRIALRADIDALRIHDQKEVEYKSRCPGLMHACGHDSHSAAVFGASAAIRQMQQADDLPWPIRFRSVFQPAEETSTGAKEMIEAGAIDDVDAIVAIHMDPSRRVGTVGLRDGVLTANCVGMRIRIVGRGGHTARPHEARDPIAAAAQLINALYLFIPRVTDSQDAVVLGIGQIHSGDNPNVIPERLELRGTLRTLDRGVHKEAIKHIRRLAHGIGQTTDTHIDVQFEQASAAVVNQPELMGVVRESARHVVGEQGMIEIPRPSMGSEDFSFYLDHIPGAMIRVGCASAERGRSPLHSPDFDIDEDALAIAARILARVVIEWSNPHRKPAADPAEAEAGSGI